MMVNQLVIFFKKSTNWNIIPEKPFLKEKIEYKGMIPFFMIISVQITLTPWILFNYNR